MKSLACVMKADITIPDFSGFSKRSMTLPRHILTKAMEPDSIVIVDSTGLKVYGKDEWHQEKHAVPARHTRRSLHLAIDKNHQVLACELTTPEVGDPTQRFQICSTKLLPLSIPSWVMAPTMANRLLKLF
jgi:hypothetical protein